MTFHLASTIDEVLAHALERAVPDESDEQAA
jgi:hypothetical protein